MDLYHIRKAALITTKAIVQASLEIWGVVICIIMILTAAIDSEYRGAEKKMLVRMHFATIIFLLSDALAWIFRGYAGTVGCVMVRVSNTAFVISGYLVLILYTRYLRRKLPEGEGARLKKWENAMIAVCSAMSLATVINLKTRWFFCFDDDNIYHRSPLNFLIPAVGAAGSVINFVFLVRNRKNMSMSDFFSLMSYVVLAGAALVILIFFYGISLTNIAVTISMIIIFSESFRDYYRQFAIREKENAELKTAILISQIKPHFLYNSLTVIKGLCSENPAEAEKAVDEFSNYLRSNMRAIGEKECVPFEEELSHVRNYLALEQRRFGERVKAVRNIGADRFDIPTLSLQPIVENAVKHGITKRVEGGTVTISSEETESAYIITVEDDGVGFDLSSLQTNGECIGINNVRRRLEAMKNGT